MSRPVVSVIIPVLNTKAYLQQCLDSLAVQTLAEIEVICVDNGSTDGSYEFLQTYAESHANFAVLRHAEGRQGGARNAGIDRATGEYIGFVDSDDFVSPVMFQEMYNAAQAARAEVVVCNFDLYYESKGLVSQTFRGDLLAGGEVFSIQQQPRLLRNLIVWNKIWSHEFIEKHKLRFPEDVFHEDQLFVIEALVLAQRIVTVSETLYFYRRARPGSVNEYRGRDSLQVFRIMEMVTDFAEGAGLDGSLKLVLNELKALKYLQLYKITGNAFRKEYFEKMRNEFRDIDLPIQCRILSPSERREFQIVQRVGYSQYTLFLLLRKMYGILRGYVRKPVVTANGLNAPNRIRRGA